MTKAVLGATLAATALTVAAPADAQRYRRGYRDDDGAGAAIVAGIAGLAIGAAHRVEQQSRPLLSRRRYYTTTTTIATTTIIIRGTTTITTASATCSAAASSAATTRITAARMRVRVCY